MRLVDELVEIAEKLDKAAAASYESAVTEPLDALEGAARKVGRSFSGSWQGYHSRVYYNGLVPTPPGAHFSQEWGLKDMSYTSLGTEGDWREYDTEDVKSHIRRLAGDPSLDTARNAARAAANAFKLLKPELVSILHTELDRQADQILEGLQEEIEPIKPLTKGEIADRTAPKGRFMTRDTLILGQGMHVPPHMEILAEVASLRNAFEACEAARDIARRAGSHLERKGRRINLSKTAGMKVFIGHGRSPLWRDLKDFLKERLDLPWEEFNRVPVAGVTTVDRLKSMLDDAAIAFLVLTAEEDLADGGRLARMNVIHEAGLFQGRLGFPKAIVMLEEGCQEFSNIAGLGQIRFPPGNIKAAFEEVRGVLEREGMIKT